MPLNFSVQSSHGKHSEDLGNQSNLTSYINISCEGILRQISSSHRYKLYVLAFYRIEKGERHITVLYLTLEWSPRSSPQTFRLVPRIHMANNNLPPLSHSLSHTLSVLCLYFSLYPPPPLLLSLCPSLLHIPNSTRFHPLRYGGELHTVNCKSSSLMWQFQSTNFWPSRRRIIISSTVVSQCTGFPAKLTKQIESLLPEQFFNLFSGMFFGRWIMRLSCKSNLFNDGQKDNISVLTLLIIFSPRPKYRNSG